MTYAGFDMDVAKFMMGHGRQIDPNKYDKIVRDIQYTTSEFRKAMPFLNVLSESPMEMSRPEVDEQMAGTRMRLNC